MRATATRASRPVPRAPRVRPRRKRAEGVIRNSGCAAATTFVLRWLRELDQLSRYGVAGLREDRELRLRGSQDFAGLSRNNVPLSGRDLASPNALECFPKDGLEVDCVQFTSG